jgi:hypothetical protein
MLAMARVTGPKKKIQVLMPRLDHLARLVTGRQCREEEQATIGAVGVWTQQKLRQ